MFHRIALMAIVVVCVGCLHSSQVTWRIDDPVVMKAALVEHVPIGTPVSAARRFMESEGFICEPRSNSSFIERRSWSDREPKHEGIDFLGCHRRESLGVNKYGLGGLLMSRKWNVALVNDGSIVTDILVSHYIDGP